MASGTVAVSSGTVAVAVAAGAVAVPPNMAVAVAIWRHSTPGIADPAMSMPAIFNPRASDRPEKKIASWPFPHPGTKMSNLSGFYGKKLGKRGQNRRFLGSKSSFFRRFGR